MRHHTALLLAAATAIACESSTTTSLATDTTPEVTQSDDSSVTEDIAESTDIDATDDSAVPEDTVSPEETAGTDDAGDQNPDVFGDPGTEGLAVAPVRGTVRIFGPPGGPLAGAAITIAEHPGLTATTDADGRFEFPEVPAGYVTLVMDADGFPENQLGTQRLAGEALEDCDFQAVSDGIYDLFALLTESEPSPEHCQISTTVTRYFEGGLPTVHGEPGATAEMDPAPAGHPGPIYFNVSLRRGPSAWPRSAG